MTGIAGSATINTRFAVNMKCMVLETFIGKNTGAAMASVTEGISLGGLGNIVPCIKIVLEDISES